MCGINGFSWEDVALIKAMNKALSHRGPDAGKELIADGVSLGHRRLAIIDLSPRGEQPMVVEGGSGRSARADAVRDVRIVFNGEIYNYAELREQLSKDGYRFTTESDTEVILAAYLAWGERCVERFNGMWAFCIHDVRRRLLFCSRDRLGIKPFYYVHDSVHGSVHDSVHEDLHGGVPTARGARGQRRSLPSFAFSSELRPLFLARGGVAGHDIDPKAIADLFRHRVILGSRTFRKGIKRLEPGHNLIYNLKTGALFTQRYWSLSSRRASSGRTLQQGLRDELRQLLESSVHYRLIADVPVGVSLSGGLDSAIVAAIAKREQADMTAYTVGFGLPGDENEEAAATAASLDMRHKQLLIDSETIAKSANKVVWHLEEPAPDPAIFASYHIYGRIRKDVTVLLLGEGSDELFAGYTEYKLHALPLPGALRDKAFAYLRNPFKQGSPARAAATPLAYTGTLNDYLRQDVTRILPGYQLLRVDKLSMAHALEARVPFLDYRVVERAMAIPAREKLLGPLHGWTGKQVLRQTARSWLRQDIVDRRKKTFFSPLETLEELMLAEADGMLAERRLAHALDYAYFRRLLDRYSSLRGRDRFRKRFELFSWWLAEKAATDGGAR